MNASHTMYICPMHPEIRQETSGRCPKCGMALVKEGSAAPMRAVSSDRGLGTITWRSYTPLFVIFGILLASTTTVAWVDSQAGTHALSKAISYFMAGFFLVFAGFKLMDLKGFTEGYSTYDLLAQRWFGYGYIYPFIELGFGLTMLAGFTTPALLLAELVVMFFSGVGVAIKLAKGEEFQCACLGTFLKVPLTYVTLIEDFGMAALALLLIIIHG